MSDSFSTNSFTSSAPTCSLIISASVSWTTSSPSFLLEGGEAKAGLWLCRRRRRLSSRSAFRRRKEKTRSLLLATAAILPLLRGRAAASGAARGRGSSREAVIIVSSPERLLFLFFCGRVILSLSALSPVLERVFFSSTECTVSKTRKASGAGVFQTSLPESLLALFLSCPIDLSPGTVRASQWVRSLPAQRNMEQAGGCVRFLFTDGEAFRGLRRRRRFLD